MIGNKFWPLCIDTGLLLNLLHTALLQCSLTVDKVVDELLVEAAVVSWHCVAVDYHKVAFLQEELDELKDYQQLLQLEELPLSLLRVCEFIG